MKKEPQSKVVKDKKNCLAILLSEIGGHCSYIPLTIDGLEILSMTTEDFRDNYLSVPDYPVEKAAKLFIGYSEQLGACNKTLEALGKLSPVTKKEMEAALARKLARKNIEDAAKSKIAKPVAKKLASKAGPFFVPYDGSDTESPFIDDKTKPKPKSAVKPIKTPKVSAKATAKADGKMSAANMFRKLILEGKLSDDEIFKAVKEEYGLDDNKRSYVKWYRNDLAKKGEKLPAAK